MPADSAALAAPSRSTSSVKEEQARRRLAAAASSDADETVRRERARAAAVERAEERARARRHLGTFGERRRSRALSSARSPPAAAAGGAPRSSRAAADGDRAAASRGGALAGRGRRGGRGRADAKAGAAPAPPGSRRRRGGPRSTMSSSSLSNAVASPSYSTAAIGATPTIFRRPCHKSLAMKHRAITLEQIWICLCRRSIVDLPASPAGHNGADSHFVVDLDQPAEQRRAPVCAAFKATFAEVVERNRDAGQASDAPARRRPLGTLPRAQARTRALAAGLGAGGVVALLQLVYEAFARAAAASTLAAAATLALRGGAWLHARARVPTARSCTRARSTGLVDRAALADPRPRRGVALPPTASSGSSACSPRPLRRRDRRPRRTGLAQHRRRSRRWDAAAGCRAAALALTSAGAPRRALPRRVAVAAGCATTETCATFEQARAARRGRGRRSAGQRGPRAARGATSSSRRRPSRSRAAAADGVVPRATRAARGARRRSRAARATRLRPRTSTRGDDVPREARVALARLSPTALGAKDLAQGENCRAATSACASPPGPRRAARRAAAAAPAAAGRAPSTSATAGDDDGTADVLADFFRIVETVLIANR